MKRNRVVAMLMAGIMAISQPVSIYASEDNINEIQTQTEDDSGGSINEESQEISDALQEPEISNEFEAEQKQEDSTIQQEAQNEEPGNESTEDQGDSSVEDFSDGDRESNDIAYPSDENITKELDWSGCLTGFDNSNIKIFISCEDGTDMEKDDILSVTDMNEKELEKIASKINEQLVDSSVSTISAFDIKRMDANNTEKENNKSYRITVLANDVSKIKEAHLYHQIEDGSMEELTFTFGSTEKGEQKIEFVSSGGLGVFSFVNVEKHSSSESQDGVEPTDSDKEINNDMAAEEENKENDISESKNTTPDLNVDKSQGKEENEENSDEKSDNGNDNKNDDESKTTAKADTEIKEDKDEAVTPVSIDEFHVSFVSGANSIDGKNVWNPSDPVSGHAFIYRVDYTMSGVFSTDIGAFKIELPLHILKDKDGNWADTFNCPYRIRTDNMGDDAPDFVYEVDEESNKVTIYNYKPYPTGEAGYVEVSYETAKNTVSYIDMGSSTKVKAKVYATNAASTVTAESEANEVYIDTHATIAYTQKKKPKLYKTWDSTWGEEPSDSKEYYYLVWPIRSYINKNTSSYDFYLNDTIADMGSEVVGYRFSGESGFSKKNHTDNILSYGDRYDYVLTRYSKKKADEVTKSNKRYDIHNDIEAVVSPSDHVDEDTNALSSYDWYYEAPVYIGKKGEFWAEKYGIYGEYNRVESSEDISNYTLGEFESGENDTLSYLKYHAIGDGSPYTFSLADGATGTVEDGSEFMLDEKESISAIIYMQAPLEDKSNKQDPIAYNNIFVQRTAIKEIGNEITEIPQFYHQDYTQAHYRISSDIGFKKVDATETTVGIKGITYKLTGTSDYGTVYNEERVSDKNGQMMFSNIEKGKYEISEIKCSDDWQLNKEAYVITVNGKGEVEINGLNVNDEGLYILQDEPRYHADVTFQKINNVTGGAVEGVVFKLSGTSEYDSEYTLYVKSNKIGRVSFKNIELGTYELKEVEAPDGYIKSKKTFTVKVDEAGKATIYDGDKELSVNGNGYYQIENEPYHTIRFLKSSTYGDNIYLEGAEFSLTGISDYGTSVNQTATSGKAEDGGLVVFSNLEPGTYTLRETKAPSGHYLDGKPYKVVIKKDGSFTIDGLDKINFGKSKK